MFWYKEVLIRDLQDPTNTTMYKAYAHGEMVRLGRCMESG